jgi:hypothetical protein
MASTPSNHSFPIRYLAIMPPAPIPAAPSGLTVAPDHASSILFVTLLVTTFMVLALNTLYLAFRQKEAAEKSRKQIEKVESAAEKQPERVKFAWDIARIKLEEYFNRNLDQAKSIFIVSVVVMFIGFAFVGYGVFVAFRGFLQPSIVAATSGIITEFIGATFMAIYRATLREAAEFMSVLERINTVGMAVQILDSMPDDAADLKNKTRAEIVNLLLAVRPPKDN